MDNFSHTSILAWNAINRKWSSTYHGPPKPTCLEVFIMVNNLVFRWPKPLFFIVLGAHGALYFLMIWLFLRLEHVDQGTRRKLWHFHLVTKTTKELACSVWDPLGTEHEDDNNNNNNNNKCYCFLLLLLLLLRLLSLLRLLLLLLHILLLRHTTVLVQFLQCTILIEGSYFSTMYSTTPTTVVLFLQSGEKQQKTSTNYIQKNIKKNPLISQHCPKREAVNIQS